MFDLKNKKYQAVILCAGRGTRMGELTYSLPKPLIKIDNNKTILNNIVEYWQDKVSEFIFVVGYQKEKIIKHVDSLDINKQYIEQPSPKGIADALLMAEPQIQDDFIVLLGDCLVNGELEMPESFHHGIGVWETDKQEHIKKSYSVEINTAGHLCKVVEKPTYLPNNLCGMGLYFFKPVVFNYIRQTPPSSLRNEVEITDTLQKMIEAGEKIYPIKFKGQYLNINYPKDISHEIHSGDIFK